MSHILVQTNNSSLIGFGKNTKILCLINNEDKYIPIQNIVNGTLVKTLSNEYVPVTYIDKYIINNVFSNNTERTKQRIYKYQKKKFSELFEDLIIAGSHSILKNKITKQQMKDTNKINNTTKTTPSLLDGKCKLMVCVDNSAEIYNDENEVEIWVITLSIGSYRKNYGIYANGLTVESTPENEIKI
jgi:hypothetical protein